MIGQFSSFTGILFIIVKTNVLYKYTKIKPNLTIILSFLLRIMLWKYTDTTRKVISFDEDEKLITMIGVKLTLR